MNQEPLDERDNWPWLEDDGSHKDVEEYEQEREVEQAEAYYASSEPW